MDVHDYKNDISIISYTPSRYNNNNNNDTINTSNAYTVGLSSQPYDDKYFVNSRVNNNNNSISISNKYVEARENNLNTSKPDTQITSSKFMTCSKRKLVIIITSSIMITLLVIAAVVATVTVLLIKNSNNNSKDVNDVNSVLTVNRTIVKLPNQSANLTYLNYLKDCGVPSIQPKVISGRIIGGFEEIPHSWPYTVSIGYVGPKATYSHVCGGTLISKRYVLTAAHCTDSKEIYQITGNPIPDDPKFSSLENMIRLYIGVHNRNTDINENTTYYSETIISHKNFDTHTFENDIALIRLSRDAELSTSVSYACLKSNIDLVPNQLVYAVGWGYTSSNIQVPSPVLMQVQLPITSASNCVFQYIEGQQFCAGNRVNVEDTCGGDSGGPTMKLINQTWTVVGITSNGDNFCTGVGIYTNVEYYLDWIGQNMIL